MLWVDAICINQRSAEEVKHQISIMREIYALAKETIVWLSGDIERYTRAMELVPQISSLVLDLLGTLRAFDISNLLPERQ